MAQVSGNKTPNPKVTIITVCYNSGQTLERTIKSVLSQTYENIEYFVIDGLSSDNTPDILERYKDRIDLIISEKDSGPTEAQIKGLRHSNGELLMYLFADDWISPDYIEKAVGAYAACETDFIFGDIHFYKKGKLSYTVPGDPAYGERIKYTMPRVNYTSIVIKKDVYIQTTIDDSEFSVAPDYQFMLESYLKGVRGTYCPRLAVFNEVGGNAQQKYLQGACEVRKIALKWGGNPVLVNHHFLKRMIGHSVLWCCDLVGLKNLVSSLRR
ncbi:glycosyltransferase [Terasakiella pusilla]|uniref:glycosyltransferase n=1 Tax=Terasakiella pusilla TaxID=64973 RepID=UPI003AA7C601